MKPFFCYFGGKWRAAPRYPQPRFATIIEPFAGAAGYATRYADRNVRLYDVNPVVVGVWDYLIKASPSDVMGLPTKITSTDDLPPSVPQEARWLIGSCR